MIEWREEGIVLAVRNHGESGSIIQLLTRERGRHAGLVRGGQSVKKRPILQPGNLVEANWSARLSDHLGNYTVELVAANAARFLDEPKRLAALASACALAEGCLPEREGHPGLYEAMLVLIEALEAEHWAEVYVQWELLLLRDLGFGLDLSSCAAGGDNDQLAYVSPKSGRAVSLAAGEPYRERLLPLPDFLAGRGGGGLKEVGLGLQLTGYFLERHIFNPRDLALPGARLRLAQSFSGS